MIFSSQRSSPLFKALAISMVLSVAVLSGCGSGIANITVSIPALATEDLATSCEYDLLMQQAELAQSTPLPVKGVLVIYERGDSRGLYDDSMIRNLAFTSNLALLWAHQCNARSTGDLQADASKGPGRALFAALSQLAKETRHAELATSGVILYGFSAAGVLTATMENGYPGRVLGAIAYAPGSAYTNLEKVAVTEGAIRVPTLILANSIDPSSGTSRSYGYFKRGRALGASWAYAVQNDTAHCCNMSTRSIIVPWIQAVAASIKAAPLDTASETPATASDGAVPNISFVCTPNGVIDVLGYPDCGFTKASLGLGKFPHEEAGWLPDQTSGLAWLAWVTHEGTND